MNRLSNIFCNVSVWAALLLASACSDSEQLPAEPAAIALRLVAAQTHSLSVELKPNAPTVCYDYAIGQAADRAAFEAGTLVATVRIDGNDVHTIPFEGLDPGRTYTVFAAARNAANEVCPTQMLEVATLAEAPEVIVRVDENSGTSLTATFTPGPSAVRYRFALGSPDDDAAFADGTLEGIVAQDVAESCTHTFGGLVPATEYAIFAEAFDSRGEAGDATVERITTAEAPYAEVAIERLDCINATVKVVFNALCEGGNAVLQTKEEYEALLAQHDGDAEAVAATLPWKEAAELTLEAFNAEATPGQSSYVLLAAFWKQGQRTETAGYLVREFLSPAYDPELPLPDKPRVEYLPSGVVLITRLYGDEYTSGLKVVEMRRSEYDAIGDEGVARRLDQTPVSLFNYVSTEVYVTGREDNVCLFARAYNANGLRGESAGTYLYEYSLTRNEQVR